MEKKKKINPHDESKFLTKNFSKKEIKIIRKYERLRRETWRKEIKK